MSNSSSFINMIENKINIPLIQRDYVQGLNLTKNNNVRKRLLKDIIESLSSENDSPHDLGMVYGSFNGTEFKPFDGQQRITTMWLFCLYLISRMKYLKIEVDEHFIELINNNFNYQVRNSTIDFMQLLKHEFINNFNSIHNSNKKITEYIRNLYNYYDKYDSDPTIKSMLGMIESINEVFNENSIDNNKILVIYKNLSSEEHIYFNYVNLKDYSLTDDIYIKLNARGLPLTDFENLKARIIGILEAYEQKQGINNDVSKEFSNICDINWENDFVFTNDGNIKKEVLSKLIDERRTNFIRLFFINQYFLYIKKDLSQNYYRVNIPEKYKMTNDEFSFEIDSFIKEVYIDEKLVKVFEIKNDEFVYNTIKKLVSICSIVNIHDKLIEYFEKFSNIKTIEYKLYFEFFTVFEYIYKNKERITNESTKLDDLIEFTNNLLDSYSNAGGDEVVKFFDKLSTIIDKCENDIYDYLSKCDINFASELSFNYILKSNFISEILKSKVDKKMREQLVSEFGVHLAYAFEFAGYLSIINNNKYEYKEIDNEFDKKIVELKEVIEINNDSRIKIKDTKIDEIRKKELEIGLLLGYKSGGFSFGTNTFSYNDEIMTFDYLLRSYKDDSVIDKRNKFFNIIKGELNPVEDLYFKVLNANYQYVKDILDKGFIIREKKVLVFTNNKNFSGYCYDVLLYVKALISKIDIDTIKMSGSYGYMGNEFKIGNDIYKIGSEFGKYIINDKEQSIIDENYNIV